MKGGLISDSVLYKLFGNPFYYGMFLWQKKMWPGTHTPMITKEEFDKAQKVIKRKTPHESDKNKFAYTRTMRCEECGCIITAEIQKRKLRDGTINEHVYYRCSKQKGPGSCSMPYLKLNRVEDKINETLDGLSIPKSLSAWMFETLREDFRAEQELQKHTLENLQRAYERYENQLKNLFNMRMNGEIETDIYETKKAEITSLRDESRERLGKADTRLDLWLTGAENDFNWVQEALEIMGSDDLPAKRVLLQKLGTETILKTTGIHIELSPLFKLVRRTQEVVKKESIVFEPNKSFIKSDYKPSLDRLPILLGDYRESNPNRRFHKPPC